MIVRFLSRLHENERGQIVPLFALGVLALVSLVVMVLNTGEQTTARMRVQDAADAATMTQATWIARSLNIISMNNVAITQAAAVVIITEALLPPLIEASAEAIRKEVRYGEALAKCLGTGWGAVVCAPPIFGLIADLTVRVVKPLYDIWDDNPIRILRDFTAITQALEDMNETVVTEFPDFTAHVARELAHVNGLDRDALIFLAGYRGQNEHRYDTTSLPVGKVTLEGIPSPLCIAGKHGTPRIPRPSADVGSFAMDFYSNWNFQQHGYPRDHGPYQQGRDSADRAISPPVDALRRFPHFGRVRLDFSDIVKTAWATACQARLVRFPPFGWYQVNLYRVKNQPWPGIPVGSKRDDWSLLAFTRKTQAGAAVFPKLFANPPQALYAYAQAEIYNAINYDLYTQDWRAKLVPARLLNAERKEAILKATAAFPTLQRLLEGSIDDRGFEATNVH